MSASATMSRTDMAARLARDIPEGWYVNLGLGLPTLIPDYIPEGREVVFHSENGVLGMGPVPPKDKVDTWLVNATKQNITKDGLPRIFSRCAYPLTAASVVKRVYTNLAVIDVTERGFEVLDMAPGGTLESLQACTDAKLRRVG